MPRRSVQTPPAAPAKKELVSKKQSFTRWAWDWLKSLAAGFALFLVVRAFILQTWVITSGSMENTLLTGDLLVLNKVAYGAQIPGTDSRLPGYTDPKRGDVVVFRAQHDTLDVIKRIIGMPGDTLQHAQQDAHRERPGMKEPYVRPDRSRKQDRSTQPVFRLATQYLIGDSAFKANYSPAGTTGVPFVVPPGHSLHDG